MTTPHPTDALPLPELPTTSYLGDGNGYGYAASDMYAYGYIVRREGYELAMPEIASLRFMLAVRVAGSALYGDDGELQDNSTRPHIDFKRDSVEEIERKLIERGTRRFVKDMNALAKPINDPAVTTPREVLVGESPVDRIAAPAQEQPKRPSKEWYDAMIKETLDDDFVIGPAFKADSEQQQAGVAEVSDEQIEKLAHRMCWQYRHSSDPHHSSTYKFNLMTLLEYTRAALKAGGVA